jgi:hypothetical protein
MPSLSLAPSDRPRPLPRSQKRGAMIKKAVVGFRQETEVFRSSGCPFAWERAGFNMTDSDITLFGTMAMVK